MHKPFVLHMRFINRRLAIRLPNRSTNEQCSASMEEGARSAAAASQHEGQDDKSGISRDATGMVLVAAGATTSTSTVQCTSTSTSTEPH